MMSPTGILNINLTALQANWRLVAEKLRQGAACAAVVKANAYGVGAKEVTASLYKAGCRYFFVVTLDEALELRADLPRDATLYVLGGARAGQEPAFDENGLVPVIYSAGAIQQWAAYCKSMGKALPCVLKLDTGMTRLGLSAVEFNDFLSNTRFHSWINPVLVMSHLACADEPGHPLNKIQLDNFERALVYIKKVYPEIKASLANSSGSFLGGDFHFDMVRIGAALYGINPQPVAVNPLHQVVHLKLPVQQIRILTEEAQIGYGATASLPSGTRLAVVAGGYADGVHRTLGLAPRGEIDAVEVRAVGRVSMDSCVFDISSCPTEHPQYIEVINSNITLDVLMAANKTLGYEVLTSLGRRYKRQYRLDENNE